MVTETIAPGYNLTEIGVIPEDWDVSEIDEIAEVKSGKRLPKGERLLDSQTPHPYIRVADMYQGGVSLNDIKYVPEEIYPTIKKYKIFEEDIFISVAGTLGIVGVIPKILNGANLTENANRLTNISCNRNYLLYVLMSNRIQSTIQSEQTIGAQPKLALTRIRKFKVSVPRSKEEQSAIAQVLFDTDSLIESLDKLIEKKKNIKQGTMQRLLSGKKRLPGFSEDWEVKKLGDVVDFIKGTGLSKTKVSTDGKNKCILYGELFTTYNEVINKIVSKTNCNEGTLSKLGDILMPGSTTTIGIDLAVASALLEDNVHLGGDINILRKKEDSVDSQFLANYLTHIQKHKISEVTQGTTIIHLYGKNLKDLSITIPNSKEEQAAIAQVLSDMNSEIERLEQKRDKYKELKIGMMQQLLTGRIRLKW